MPFFDLKSLRPVVLATCCAALLHPARVADLVLKLDFSLVEVSSEDPEEDPEKEEEVEMECGHIQSDWLVMGRVLAGVGCSGRKVHLEIKRYG